MAEGQDIFIPCVLRGLESQESTALPNSLLTLKFFSSFEDCTASIVSVLHSNAPAVIFIASPYKYLFPILHRSKVYKRKVNTVLKVETKRSTDTDTKSHVQHNKKWCYIKNVKHKRPWRSLRITLVETPYKWRKIMRCRNDAGNSSEYLFKNHLFGSLINTLEHRISR